MDLIKIGKFISELRHEKNLTQEELGEKIGVTNKTISRWWVKGHLVLIAICIILTLGFISYGIFTHTNLVIVSAIFVAFVVYIILYNMMMAYVERNAYDGSGW